jgi:hypothetical protein
MPTTAISGACCSAPPIALTALGAAFPGAVSGLTLLDPSAMLVPGVMYLGYFAALIALDRRLQRHRELSPT